MVILTSGVKEGVGIVLTQNAFTRPLGIYGYMFIAICLFFFAFSTIIGWYFFGERNIRYLFKNNILINIYKVIVMIIIVGGSILKVELVWEMADMFNEIMVLSNLIALLALRKYARNVMKEYDNL